MSNNFSPSSFTCSVFSVKENIFISQLLYRLALCYVDTVDIGSNLPKIHSISTTIMILKT